MKLSESDNHYTRAPQKTVSLSLLLDQMKINPSWLTERLVGFNDLSDINNDLDDFNGFIKQGCREPELATYVLSLMARGLFKYFNYPVGYFASVGFDSDRFYLVVCESVGILEGLRIHVRAFVPDGALHKRKLFCLHECAHNENVSIDGEVYWS